MKAPYLIGVALLALGAFAGAVPCLVLAGVALLFAVGVEVRVVRTALLGPYPAEVAQALIDKRLVSAPARLVLRRTALKD